MKRLQVSRMTLILFLMGATIINPAQAHGQSPDYAEIKLQAEKEYLEKSFACSHDLYLQADRLDLEETDKAWVRFRLADTLWRSQASDGNSEKMAKACETLNAIADEKRGEDEQDQLWAEAQESLGDYDWDRRDAQNWSSAWEHYRKALNWWAGARDLERARSRYLAIVWRCARPTHCEPYYYYGYYGNYLPQEILENVLKIVRTPEEISHAHYLMAMGFYHQGGAWDRMERIPEEFEMALKVGKSSEWYDDALFNYAHWLASSGKRQRLPNGQWQQTPDYPRALEMYRRILNEFKKGQTRYWEETQEEIENITASALEIQVANIFLPDSEIEAHLNWRNQKQIDLTIYALDLTSAVALGKNQDGNEWLQSVSLSGLKKIKSWSKVIAQGEYLPGNETVRLDRKLESGAYMIEAVGGGERSRDLILVSDATLVLKSSGRQVLAFFCDVHDGTPIPEAAVRLWTRKYVRDAYAWKSMEKKTNADGLAVFELEEGGSDEVFAAARSSARQAFAVSTAYGYSRASNGTWRTYVFTDRAAYRPGDTVQWKMLARVSQAGDYFTPAQQSVSYEIQDPRGAKLKADTLKLNAFGSAWGSLELTESLPLGEYHIYFYSVDRAQNLGSATLFRLEEYKLPEFKVAIQLPEENGRKKAFRLGETVEASIQADYYFGGPVGNASVEVVVYQKPYYRYWVMDHEFSWYYDDMRPQSGYWGNGQVIKREMLKTDSLGRAVVSFATPRGAQDMEYRIEARVVDASRREVVGTDAVRVTQHRYEVNLRPEHCLYRPQDKITVAVKAADANQNPVAVSGTVRVTRDRWVEIWLDPAGQPVFADAWHKQHPQGPAVPWAGSKPELGWQMKFQGYEHEDVQKSMLTTDAKGEAEISFSAGREGYYRVAWESEDGKDCEPVTAETMVWAANHATSELGYRHGGLEIIIDKDTVKSGQKAPVMVMAPASGRTVLFSVEGEDLYSYQVLRMNGTAKLLELPIESRYVPNVFLNATLVSDLQLFQDTKQVVVPPVEHFLNLEIKPDKAQYRSQEEGTFTLTARDSAGKPVAAEIALGVVDEAVSYIQADYAQDLRQYYYGSKRSHQVRTDGTLNQRSYARLEPQASVPQPMVAGGMLCDKDALTEDESAPVMASNVRMSASKKALRGESKIEAKEKMEFMTPSLAAVPAAAPEPQSSGGSSVVTVRQDFRATAFWQPDVQTDANGEAKVTLKYPDSLTAWKAVGRAASSGNQFGLAQVATRTQLPLIVRLEGPRFFLTKDRVVVSAVVNNNTDQKLEASVTLKAEGLETEGATACTLQVAPNSEARADWTLEVRTASEAKLRVETRAGVYGDAMEKTFAVYEHGLEKFVAKAGKVRGQDSKVLLELPAARKPESTTLTLQIAPGLAVTLLDSLPYLFDYPYGCTEQTLSRFLPAVVVTKTLRNFHVKPATLARKMFGGVEKGFADKTHPEGPKDFRQLDDMVKKGLERLYDFQHSDGGWGWWKEGESDSYMTAYVLWGLTLASEAGVGVRAGVLERAGAYLNTALVRAEDAPDLQAWMLHAQARWFASQKQNSLTDEQTKALNRVWDQREKLNAYSRSLLALACYHFGLKDKAGILIRNLEDGVIREEKPDTTALHASGSEDATRMATAHWGKDQGYWRWSEGSIEATSFGLQALMAVDPKNALVEPVMNWLVKNRRGAQWSNTRDTAIAILGLNDYLRTSGELQQDLNYEVLVNGHPVANCNVSAEESLGAPSVFEVQRDYLKDGGNEIQMINRNNLSSLYFAAQAKFFSLEEPVTAAGSEIFVRRQYFKYVGRPTLLKGYVYDKVPLSDNETVTSNERIETVVTIDAKNDYEYLLFEDLKPAGFEAVETRSGEPLYAQEIKPGSMDAIFKGQGKKKPKLAAGEQDKTWRKAWVFQELRDRKVALFISKLPQGLWEIRYPLRAEVPGRFHALPVVGHAMYVPEIRCNGCEERITVEDEKKYRH